MEDIRFTRSLHHKINHLSFVSVVRNKNFTFPYKKGKPSFSFIFIQRGALRYFFTKDKQVFHLQQDDMLFIPKDYPYIATYLADNTKIQILNFNFDSLNLPVTFLRPIHKKSPEASMVFNSISPANRSNPLFLAAKIYELLYQIESSTQTTPTRFKKLLPAVKEFQQAYFKNEKISYYADLCHMSESNFRKLFKEYTSLSPIEYRNKIRILNIKQLLSSGEFKIGEAAYLVGFNNMAFFYEVYNKYKEQDE